MLMDLFYNTLPTRVTRKRRVHFHAFMVDVHKRMHAAKAAGAGDPLMPVARDLANEARVLCLDEFQVTDIADAMILRRLLDSLLKYGVVCVLTSKCVSSKLPHVILALMNRWVYVVATPTSCTRTASNAPPSFLQSIFSRLNSTSLTLIRAQVHYFPPLPFVPPLISHPCVNTADYRRVPRALSHAYFSPLNSVTRAAIDAQFAALTEGIPIQDAKTIRLWGRHLAVPRSAGHVAQFTFAELCGRPLGAADYLELTQRFGTIFVTEVPRMGLGEKDKVRQAPRLFCYLR